MVKCIAKIYIPVKNPNKNLTVCSEECALKQLEEIKKYGSKRIPSVSTHWIDSVDYDLRLIEPNEMSDMCSQGIGN